MIGEIKKSLINLLQWLLLPVVKPIVEKILDEELEVRFQLREYINTGEEKLASYWESQFNAEKFVERFAEAGLEVETIAISLEGFKQFLKTYPRLVEFYSSFGDVKIEKLLEHYLTLCYLPVKESDILIDVASASSPFAEVLRSSGTTAYQQDLVYPNGIKRYTIGGNASAMPVEDNFADVLTLHCSFECFQGGSDIHFSQEAGRVLKSGGRLGIVPLYIDTISFVKTSPYCDKRDISIDKNDHLIWRDDQYREPFSRHYSPEDFISRIVSQMRSLNGKIIFFSNLDIFSEEYKGQRIYCHFMFKGEKK